MRMGWGVEFCAGGAHVVCFTDAITHSTSSIKKACRQGLLLTSYVPYASNRSLRAPIGYEAVHGALTFFTRPACKRGKTRKRPVRLAALLHLARFRQALVSLAIPMPSLVELHHALCGFLRGSPCCSHRGLARQAEERTTEERGLEEQRSGTRLGVLATGEPEWSAFMLQRRPRRWRAAMTTTTTTTTTTLRSMMWTPRTTMPRTRTTMRTMRRRPVGLRCRQQRLTLGRLSA